jgi:small conductance mechanosensitive channel
MDAQNLENLKQFVLQKAIDYGPRLMVGILFLILGSMVAGWVGKVFAKWLEKRRLEPPVQLLLTRLLRLLVMGVFVMMAMQNLGIELLPLMAGLGVAGVGIGLALQGVLQNLVAGLLIIITKPFRVSEYIEILGVHGEVQTIELFSTTLKHPDQSRVVIPNRKIVGEILHNYGKIRQLDLTVGVALDTDMSQAISLAREVVLANPRVLKDMAPVIGVSSLGDSAAILSVKPWVGLPDFGPAGAELYQALINRFLAAGIRIPSPQREVRVINAVA